MQVQFTETDLRILIYMHTKAERFDDLGGHFSTLDMCKELQLDSSLINKSLSFLAGFGFTCISDASVGDVTDYYLTSLGENFVRDYIIALSNEAEVKKEVQDFCLETLTFEKFGTLLKSGTLSLLLNVAGNIAANYILS